MKGKIKNFYNYGQNPTEHRGKFSVFYDIIVTEVKKMDLLITGKFIKEQRKAKGLTQVMLAEKLNVSEKTVSKWECGNGFPDTSLMLPLCEALGITANDLLSGKLLSSDEYKSKAEENLILLKDRNVKDTKHLLTLEYVVGYMASVTFIVMMFVASFVEMETLWRALLIAFGVINFIVGMLFAIKIEKDAGFYECGHCHHKYIPTYRAVLFSMHIGRTRYMKCPKCGKRSWNKKAINKD